MLHETASTPRARRHRTNERRILDTALRFVTERGFAALSMSKLAHAVDYTPGALYRYFTSKDALLSALVSRILDDLRRRLDAAVADLATPAPLSRVFALARAYRAFAIDEPHRFGLLAMSLADPQVLLTTPGAAEPVVDRMIATMSPLADALGAAASSGQLRPGVAVDRTLLVFASLQGVLQLHKQARIAPDIIDTERLGTQAVRALLAGWGADLAALDAAANPTGDPS